ncbi:response regulator transcription factor [Anaerococcus tetradius]|uniref:response regulator transcription factor n=1 Tax=Anaerococcus tetradius TaxID=33036 RepID=UPI0023F4AFF6|nr:response regulator transcription factor [Anaerococcus tetradius]
MKIVIVEDDKNISKLLADELRSWGYETSQIDDFNKVKDEVMDKCSDLVLMDISLPSYNGFYWTQELRKVSKVPIIFISSHTEAMDIIQAMQFGADDYITKPINIAVTRAKIQAILRRCYDYKLESDILLYDSCSLNILKATVSHKNTEISLTRTELMILESLFQAKGEIVSRDNLIEKCWQSENFIDDNTLAVNINRLRKKLKDLGKASMIQTKKGLGYYLSEEI